MIPNSQYLKWFREIEKTLWSFYQFFEDLCSQCALHTISDLEKCLRKNRNLWCCCMIDNQIHDNWESLNTIQIKFDNNWHEKIKTNYLDLGKNRMPGNGPCPALGNKGCLLTKYRPITCTTQLCEKMLVVLYKLNISPKFKNSPLQIEDIVSLPNILPILYGTCHKDKKVELKDVQEYVKVIKELSNKLKNINQETRKKIINEVIGEYHRCNT